MSYAEKLKDPRWQKKRLEILERDGWQCQGCGQQSKMLSVHHSYYTWGMNPWDYPNDSLFAVCENCHGIIGLMSSALVYEFAKRLRPSAFINMARNQESTIAATQISAALLEAFAEAIKIGRVSDVTPPEENKEDE